ncbi:unnamed protein product [Protopolystoma xenopodis]|uniref:Uncharacterized protein n=1 Tax=Protopolystoma xenopodis TaxID=117903 RepID=A0A448WWJ8_9PLAT|nr:unnamed protein product [Protopolystoma xenopodis]
MISCLDDACLVKLQIFSQLFLTMEPNEFVSSGLLAKRYRDMIPSVLEGSIISTLSMNRDGSNTGYPSSVKLPLALTVPANCIASIRKT